LLILIRQMAPLVRCALAEVCSVLVLLVFNVCFVLHITGACLFLAGKNVFEMIYFCVDQDVVVSQIETRLRKYVAVTC